MDTMPATTARDYAAMEDGALVACVRAGEREAFRQIVQRCNQRMFRVVRGVLRADADAEDVVQEAYVRAYERIDSFRGESSLATWLTRIALNEAYGRLRKRHDRVDIEQDEALLRASAQVLAFPGHALEADPADAAARAQMRRLLEQAVDALPEAFRLVYVLREVEGCSVEETVKTRLHRARRRLREALHERVAASLPDAFAFLGARCARMTDAVMARIAAAHR
jgi:RNA polymerase sigma-70 factor (ECF subfamily)